MIPANFRDCPDVGGGGGIIRTSPVCDDLLFHNVVKLKRKCSLVALFDRYHLGVTLASVV